MVKATKRMIPLGATSITEAETVEFVVALEESIQAHDESLADPDCPEATQGRIVERRNLLRQLSGLLCFGLKNMTDMQEMETECPHGLPIVIKIEKE